MRLFLVEEAILVAERSHVEVMRISEDHGLDFDPSAIEDLDLRTEQPRGVISDEAAREDEFQRLRRHHSRANR